MMEILIEYAPIILVVIGFATAYKVFVTPGQLSELKTQLIEYIAEHYMSKETCHSQTAHISDAIDLLREDVKKIDKKLDHAAELIAIRIKQNEGKG